MPDDLWCECCDYGDEYADCTCCIPGAGVPPPSGYGAIRTLPPGGGPEKVTLERQKVASFVQTHPQFMADMKITEGAVDFIHGIVVTRFESFIYGNSVGRIEYSFPATWWDHFKREVLLRSAIGRWYVRRHPVRLSWSVKSARTMFPQNEIRPPGLGPPVYHVDDADVRIRGVRER